MKYKKAVLVIIIFAVVTPLSILPFIRAANWEMVTTVTGSADQTSKSFSISAQEWRLQWSYTPDPKFPSLTFFGVLVYPQKEGATYVDSFYVNGSTQTSGTEYIHEGAKDYHLEILDANIPSYTIVVQQYVETSSSTPNGNSGTQNTTFPILAAVAIAVMIVVAVTLLLQRRKSDRNLTASADITVKTVSFLVFQTFLKLTL
jgi:hypothetical protein